MRFSNVQNRIFTSLILFTLLILMFKSVLISTYLLIVFGVLSIIEFIGLSKKIFKKNFLRQLTNISFIIYILIFCFLFYFLSNFLFSKIILYTLILGCIASDIGGFIFGKLFKGKKLTKISPNKTYAGAFGSLFLTLIFSIIYSFSLSLTDLKVIIFISIIISLISQIGDLFISYLKRKAKLKDTGDILPGHGGILDRIDGILFAVPSGIILINYFY